MPCVRIALLVAAPLVARYARSEIWILWAIAVAFAAITWISLLILFGFLLPVLAL